MSDPNMTTTATGRSTPGAGPVQREFATRRRLLRQSDDGRQRRHQRQFFFDLDVATYPHLLVERRDPLLDAIEPFTAHLFTCLTQRGLHALQGRHWAGDRTEDARHARAAARIEARLRPIFGRSFPAAGGVDPHQLWLAFASFVDGDLQLPVPAGRDKIHGGPDGIAFFLFAEMALYFCRDRRRQPFWSGAVRPLVLAAEAYAEVHWDGGRRIPESYAFRPPIRRFDDKRWSRLWHSWTESSLPAANARFARLIAHALRDMLAARSQGATALPHQDQEPRLPDAP